jgi:hypothetical protein
MIQPLPKSHLLATKPSIQESLGDISESKLTIDKQFEIKNYTLYSRTTFVRRFKGLLP